MMDMTPLTLEGNLVRLEPLTWDAFPELCKVALGNREIWRWTADIQSEQDLRAYLETAFAWQAAEISIPFVIRSRRNGAIVGSTRYLDIEPAHRTVEIGATWIDPVYQRTGINVEMKYLMLRHAFESMGCVRVALKTHHNNLKSQAAIRALGAVEEGTFRNHRIHFDGTARHTVWFSIIQEDWQAVKRRLEEKMERHRIVS
ncbi:MAG: GNAT family N-acetyltransferase [Acidobacteriaceae bacterium]